MTRKYLEELRQELLEEIKRLKKVTEVDNELASIGIEVKNRGQRLKEDERFADRDKE